MKPENVLGPFRPPVDPGRPIEFLDDDVTEILSVGLAIDARILREMQSGGSAAILDRATVPLGKSEGGIDRFGHLRRASPPRWSASRPMRSANGRGCGDGVDDRTLARARCAPLRKTRRDALDALIDTLTSRKQED